MQGLHVDFDEREHQLNAFVLHLRVDFDILEAGEDFSDQGVESLSNLLLVTNHEFPNQIRAFAHTFHINQALNDPVTHLLVVNRNSNKSRLNNVLFLADES